MERRYDMERDTSLEGNAMKHNIVTRRGNQTEHIISFNLSHIFKFSNDHIISVMSATYVNTIIGTHTYTHTHKTNYGWNDSGSNMYIFLRNRPTIAFHVGAGNLKSTLSVR